MDIKVKWIVDDYLLQGTLSESLPRIIKELGYECFVTKWIPFSDEASPVSFKEDECVIVYGTHGIVDQLGNKFKPGAYSNSTVTRCSTYLPLFKGNLLNEDYKFIKYEDAIKQPFPYFIRPNDGTKSFSGTVVFDETDLKKIDPTKITEDIVTASLQDISGEYRFLIVNNQVVAGSQYRYMGRLDVRRDYPQEALEMAEYVATFDMDLKCYMCDIAMTENGAKIIELNSFSSSGLYACDQEAIVDAVSKQAMRDYND